MSTPAIRATALTRIVKSGDAPLTILDAVGFDIGPGETVAIVGASGSGKTTLLGLLAGLDRPTAGELPLELAAAPDAAPRASDWLARVGLAARATHYPRQLSGGEQQRVAIARAFAGEPKILMADEPTGNLDGATGAEVADLMFRLNRENGTILVVVTHDEAIAARCERRLSLAAGRLVADVRSDLVPHASAAAVVASIASASNVAQDAAPVASPSRARAR